MSDRKTWRLAMPMYNVSQEMAQAWEELLRRVITGLQDLGWTDTLEIVEPPCDLIEFWQSPDVLLSQTCGYPFVTQLIDKVRLIATPVFNLPGCNGINYSSYFVVRGKSNFSTLESLRGGRAVINQPHSQSGMNALRHVIAPLALDGHFFSEIRESGSHLASLDWVQRGDADVAAIDCVTFGLAQRHAPKWVEGIRVLGTSQPTPGLPLISAVTVSDAQANDMLRTLNSLEVTEPELLRFLCLTRFEKVQKCSYGVIRDQIAHAIFNGYPTLR